MYERTRDEGFGPEVKRRIMLGTYVLSAGYYDAYYLKAQQVRTLLRQDYERAFERVDVVATPTTPTPAFKLGEKTSDPLQMYLNDIFTVSANLTGLPAISVPCGFSAGAERLPIGLQLTGRAFDEATLLRAADAYQRDTTFHTEDPPSRRYGGKPRLMAIVFSLCAAYVAYCLGTNPAGPFTTPDSVHYLNTSPIVPLGYPFFLKIVGARGAIVAQPILFAAALAFLGREIVAADAQHLARGRGRDRLDGAAADPRVSRLDPVRVAVPVVVDRLPRAERAIRVPPDVALDGAGRDRRRPQRHGAPHRRSRSCR